MINQSSVATFSSSQLGTRSRSRSRSLSMRLMAGNGKDHWLWNTRANDTGSIVEGYSRFIQSAVRRPMRSMRSMRGGFIFRNRGPSLKVHHCQHLASVTNLCPPARLLNLLPLVRLRTSPHSRRYGVTITGFAGNCLSGRSPPLRGCASVSFF